MKSTKSFRRRLTLAIVLVFAVVVVFTGRLVDLQVIQASQLTAKAVQNRSTKVITYGDRGSIVDDSGKVLAASVNRFDITVAPVNVHPDGFDRVVKNVKTHVSVDEALNEVASATGGDAATMRATIDKDPTSKYAVLAKGVTLKVLDEVTKLDIPWIYKAPDQSRTYPNGAVAGNIVGFEGTDGPQAGIELVENKCLAGTNGSSTYEKSADGVRIPGSTVSQKDPKDGGTIDLTIDSDLQAFAQQAISQRAQQLGAKWATAVVIRVKDAHLMAVADYPTVDPNNVSAASRNALGSRAFAIPYEPGSTFKAMSVASMLDAGVIQPTTQIVVPSRYTTGLPKGAYIKDSFSHGTLHYTTAGVIQNSSNIGVSILSQNLGAQARHDYMVKFGIGSKTAVNFGGFQSAGQLQPANQWDAVTNRAVEFGQGVSATSVQVASIFQTLANGGVKKPVTLVKGCTQADGTVTEKPSTTGTRVVSAKAAKETLEMMETVANGSGPLGNALKIPGYRIAAKTGTAQVAVPGKGYGDDRVVSVAGVAPADDPQYVVLVTFGEPSTMKTSAAAAPTFVNIMTQVLKKYRVEPSGRPAPFIQTTW